MEFTEFRLNSEEPFMILPQVYNSSVAFCVMSQFTTRQARIEDLNTLYSFEQRIIAAERPYNETLRSGHINYYDLKEMMYRYPRV